MKTLFLNSTLIFLFLCSLSLSSFGQAPEYIWSAVYGDADEFNHNGASIIELPDGGFIIAGQKIIDIGAFKTSVYVFKINAEGTLIWSKLYGGDASEGGASMAQASDGGFVIAGSKRFFSTTGTDAWIFKIAPNGDTLWSNNFGGNSTDVASYISPTSDNGFIITGFTSFYGVGDQVYLVKIDDKGDTLWTKNYGDEFQNYGNYVRQTSDGGYIIAGRTYRSYSGNSDLYMIKTDDQGVKDWEQKYGEENNDDGKMAVEHPTDNGYLLVGSLTKMEPYSQRIYLVHTDEDGNIINDYDYGVSEFKTHTITSACITQDRNLLIGGTAMIENWMDAKIFLIKINLETMDTLWAYTFGHIGSGSAVIQTTDFDYMVLGKSTEIPANTKKVFLMRLGYSNETTNYIESRTDLNIDLSSTETTDNLLVNDAQTEVLGVTITIDALNYNFIGDIELKLEHLGKTVSLVNQAPNSGENFTGTKFFDGATIPISMGSEPYTGIFIPEDSLSTFNGLNPNGDWILHIIDHNTGGKSFSGTLNGWTLKLLTDAESGTGILSPEETENFLLYPCYPNPLNEETRIEFKIPKKGHVNLVVYNQAGQMVKILIDMELYEGEHSKVWNVGNISAGTYFLHLESNGIISVQKIVVIK